MAVGTSPIELLLDFTGVQFPNGRISPGWYAGQYPFLYLKLEDCHIETIEMDAFEEQIFENLWRFIIRDHNVVTINIIDGALNGLTRLRNLVIFDSLNVRPGIFHPLQKSLTQLEIWLWFGQIGISETFANGYYPSLRSLSIRCNGMQGTKFQCLHSDNFTTMKYLRILSVGHCGVEYIDEHAFYAIANSLEYVSFDRNPIKYINIRMFRRIFETKTNALLRIGRSQEIPYCTCDLIETDTMVCPSRTTNESCLECTLLADNDSFDVPACGIRRIIAYPSVCIAVESAYFPVINFRIWLENQSIRFQTNFSSTFRVWLRRNINVMTTSLCGESCVKPL